MLLITSGLFGGLGHVTMVLAFRRAEASVLAPFEYLTLVWATLGGLTFFGDQPNTVFYMAAVFIVCSAFIASKSKQKTADLSVNQA